VTKQKEKKALILNSKNGLNIILKGEFVEMKKKWLSLLAIVGMLVILIISSVTPVMAAGSSNSGLSTTRLPTTTTAKLSISTIVLGGTVVDVAQLGYSTSATGVNRPKPAGTFTFQVQQVSTTRGVSYQWVTYSTVSLNSSTNVYRSIAYSPKPAGAFLFRAIYSGDNYYVGSTSASEQLRVNAAVPAIAAVLSSSSIKQGNTVYNQVSVRGLGGLFPVPSGTVNFQVKYTLIGAWVTYNPNVLLRSGKAVSSTYKPPLVGNYYFRAIYSGDTNYKSSQSAVENLSVTMR
jgi:hypothetical protein